MRHVATAPAAPALRSAAKSSMSDQPMPQREPGRARKQQKRSHGGRGGGRGGGHAGAAATSVDHPLPEGGIHVDGSQLEGGGQILRNASALAAITHTPIKVDKIRAGRSNPGLRPQHLTGLQLIAELSGGRLEGGAVGSTCITLRPGPLACGSHVGDTKTAGSCMLLAQAALPCLLFAAPAAGGSSTSHLELRGGTDAAMAPPIDYMEHVLLPTLRAQLGIQAEMELQRRGFFPKGQGTVQLTVEALGAGAVLPPVRLDERGEVVRISTYAFTAGRVGPAVAQRMADAAGRELKRRLPECGMASDATFPQHFVHEAPERAFGDGCAILLVAQTTSGCLLGASALGERGVPAEALGQQAATELADALASGACVDEHLQDQLIIFMALAEGQSRVLAGELSLHTQTAIAVAQKLVPGARFSVTRVQAPEQASAAEQEQQQQGAEAQQAVAGDSGGGLWLISCQGAGMRGAGTAAMPSANAETAATPQQPTE